MTLPVCVDEMFVIIIVSVYQCITPNSMHITNTRRTSSTSWTDSAISTISQSPNFIDLKIQITWLL